MGFCKAGSRARNKASVGGSDELEGSTLIIETHGIMGGWPLRVCGREFGINENWHFSIRSASRGSQALHAPEAVAL
jgi:hypothetical protein